MEGRGWKERRHFSSHVSAAGERSKGRAAASRARTHLVLGGVTDEALGVGERDIGGGGAVTLIVGDDLDAARGGRGGGRWREKVAAVSEGSRRCDKSSSGDVARTLWRIHRKISGYRKGEWTRLDSGEGRVMSSHARRRLCEDASVPLAAPPASPAIGGRRSSPSLRSCGKSTPLVLAAGNAGKRRFRKDGNVPVVLPDADAGVGGTEVDTDSGSVNLSHVLLGALGGG